MRRMFNRGSLRALGLTSAALGLAGCPSPRTPPVAVISEPGAAAATPDGGMCMPLGDVIAGRYGEAPGLSSGCSTSDYGGPLTPHWSLVDQPVGSTAAIADASSRTPTFVPDVPGDYLVQLVVSDGVLTSAPALVTVEVGDCGTADPAISAPTVLPTDMPSVGQAVRLGVTVDDADTATDCGAHAAVFTYAWQLEELPVGSAATLNDAAAASPSITPDVPGAYVARVTVTDPTGRHATETVTFEAATCGSNAPALTVEPVTPTSSPAVGQAVQLGVSVDDADAAAGCAAHDPVFTYAWTLESLPLGSDATLNATASANPSITPDVPGDYVARVTVTDPTGRSATDTVTFTASTCGTNRPTVSATGSTPSTSVGLGVQLRALGADADNDAGTCALSQSLSYAWRLVEVPAGSLAAITGPEAIDASLTPDVPGRYTAAVVVTDSTGLRSDSALVSFDADACGTAAPVAVAQKVSPGTAIVCDGSRFTVDLAFTTQSILFDAVGSSDADNGPACGLGQNLFYEWQLYTTPARADVRFRTGTTGRTADFSTGTNGEYRVRLIVRDSTGRISRDAICYFEVRNAGGG